MQFSIIFPAKDEEETIGENVKIARSQTDSVYVVDNCSQDETAKLAKLNGARIIPAHEKPGKGWAVKRGLEAVLKENPAAIMFLDADLKNLSSEWIVKLIQDLKIYDRVQSRVWRGEGNGLITEFVAKPLLETFFPGFPKLDQPLIGEWVAKEKVFANLPMSLLPDDWGIDLAILIWTVLLGFSIGEVGLGKRFHTSTKKYTTKYLADMARQVVKAVYRIYTETEHELD